MKKEIIIIILAAAALCGCQKEEQSIPDSNSKPFIATIDDNFSGAETKTSLDSQGNVLWKQGDQISIFAGSTINEQWQVTDASDGKTAAGLNKVSGAGFNAGGEIDNNVAFYPYSSENTVAKSDGGYVIEAVLPSVQNYAEASFGNGAFPMAAVTSSTTDMNLKFKNILGGLKLQLKGTATIASISITGNNDEILCGAANVAASVSGKPSINLTDVSAKTVTLDCGDGVQLDADAATPFVIALPPMTMTGGFTVTVTDTEGKQMEIKTTKSQTITRSSILKMPVVTYEGVLDKPDYVPFEDANFKAYCVENFDADGDGEISIEEAEKVESITVDGGVMESLKGIEYFSQLKVLVCTLEYVSESRGPDGKMHHYDSNENEVYSQLTSLDVSNHTALIYLGCFHTQLTSLDVSGCTALTSLCCHCNQLLTSLDVSGCTALTSLDCADNQLTSLDVSSCTALTSLSCDGNQFTILDMGKNTTLSQLHCGNNPLASLDVSGCTALTSLSCRNSKLTNLDVSNNTYLTSLSCDGNQLTSLDVSKNTALFWLSCDDNQLSTLDVSNNTSLTSLYCWGNQLTTLDVSGCTALETLYCNGNQLTILDISKSTVITQLDCHNNQLSSLDVSKNTALTQLYCQNNQISTIYVWEGFDPSKLAYCIKDDSATFEVKTDYVPFEDANFKAYCVKNFDTDGDGEISIEEAEGVKEISVSTNEITSLAGIEYFTNLTNLSCNLSCSWSQKDNDGIMHYYDAKGNEVVSKLASLDVSKNTALTYLECHNNQLTSLDVSKNTALTNLRCYYNQLKSLDVSNNTALIELDCHENQLTSLDISNNTSLKYLWCYDNQFTKLDVSYNTSLTSLNCYNNQITSLDVSYNTALNDFDCSNNQLTSLDVSKNTALKFLNCKENQLTILDVSKNTALKQLQCQNNQISTIYVWEGFDPSNLTILKDSSASFVVKQ